MCKRYRRKSVESQFMIIIALVLMVSVFSSCSSSVEENEQSKEEQTNQTSKEKKADTGELPELSIYNLPSSWTTQNNKEIQLEDLKGDVIVMVMIYTSCKSACPRLVADIRRIHENVSDKANKNTKYVFVSIDPEVDTPEKLKNFAIENKMDNDQWLFLRGSVEDTREFSAVLAVSYKRISPIDFSHSNIISVFDQQGVLQHQKEGLGIDDSETVEAIEELANS